MDILAGLNRQQREAVTAPDGAVLVLAGPGSGKTRVLTHRIAYLVQQGQVPVWRIMAVTFTNKAAREMRERVETMLGGAVDGLTLGTFHATCARILRREAEHLPVSADFVIYDSSDQESLIKQALKQLNLDDKQNSPRGILHSIGRAKNELISPEDYEATSYPQEIVRRVYEVYQKSLRENNALDFGDLLMEVVLLFDREPAVLQKYQERYRHILVDEFQDTNTVQYALIKRLSGLHGNLFCVGDEDQSIYLFRGADWRNVRRFRDDFECLTILLEQNYRSTQMILDAAQAVIKVNPYRTHKALFTERPGGKKITIHEAFNEDEEAEYILEMIQRTAGQGRADLGDFAIMYRTNAQSRRLEEAFVRAGLPYRLVGATRFYGRREVKDTIAYLRVVHNPLDSVSLLRIINVPTRAIGNKTLETLQSYAVGQGISLAEALARIAAGEKHPFSGRAANALTRFNNLLAGWLMRRDSLPVAELMDLVLEESGYRAMLHDGSPEEEERWENVLELRSVAADYPDMTLSEFLEQVALVSDADTLPEGGSAPTLLTLHAAKGLEFPIVFIVGLEDEMLPHKRSWDDPDQMAEERRLLYVGITRAKDELYLIHCFRRSNWGNVDYGRPSRFLSDIPDELVSGRAARADRTAPSKTDWSWSSADSRRNLPTPAWMSPRAPSPAPAAAAPSFSTGQQVRHPKFGDGVVVESKLADGDSIVTIAFKDAGLKRLLGSLAKLEIVEEPA